jgi:hypothetical protein
LADEWYYTTGGTKTGPVIFESYGVCLVLLSATAIPRYAYLIMLIYYLSLDIISAIVSIPSKLDLIADSHRRRTAKEQN